MFRERLEKDGVHHLMLPDHDLAGSPANAADTSVGEIADGPTVSGGSPATEHSESRNKGEGGGADGKSSDNAATAPASAAASPSAPSALVPRGAYRRLLCVPAGVSWEAAAPREGIDGEAGESAATESLVPCDRAEGVAVAPVAGFDGCGIEGGAGEGRKGGWGGGSVGRDEPRNAEVRGGSGGAGGSGEVSFVPMASSALRPVWDDVRLTFTLPPGSFATMFLREVMKANGDVAWEAKAAGGNEEGEEGLVAAVGADEI